MGVQATRFMVRASALVVLSALSATLLSMAWQASSDVRPAGESRPVWIDASSRWIAEHAPLGRAAPATGPWPTSDEPADVWLLAWVSGWWAMDEVAAADTMRASLGPIPAAPRTTADRVVEASAGASGAASLLALHASLCFLTLVGYRRMDGVMREQIARSDLTSSVRPRGLLLEVMVLAGLAVFTLPALAQCLWAIWWHVPAYRSVMPSGLHEWGVATGPWARTGMHLGLGLACLLCIDWVVRHLLARRLVSMERHGRSASSFCLRCGYDLSGLTPLARRVRCPECGASHDAQRERPVIALGGLHRRVLASQARWAFHGALWLVVAMLLCSPLMISWFGWTLTDDVWKRYTPW